MESTTGPAPSLSEWRFQGRTQLKIVLSLGRPHTPVALNHHTSYSKSDLHCGACQWYWGSKLRYGLESGRLRYACGGGYGPTDNTGCDDLVACEHEWQTKLTGMSPNNQQVRRPPVAGNVFKWLQAFPTLQKLWRWLALACLWKIWTLNC